MNKLVRFMATAALFAAMLCPALVAAQEEGPSYGDNLVKAKVAGVIGGAFVGGEMVIAVEALIGVEPLWPYLTFPLIGAAGGGVGGYFLAKASPEGAVAMLIAGIALIIPTGLAVSAARAYDPGDEGAEEDNEGQFSFETTPSGEAKKEGTTTEVESRPEGAPTEALPPPGSPSGAGGPEAEPEPEVEPEPEAEPEPEVEPEPEGDKPAGEDKTSTSRLSDIKRSARLAKLRRATAGTLFYVDRDGSTSMTVPFVDVRPAYISMDNTAYRGRQAVEVYVPLLRVDLP